MTESMSTAATITLHNLPGKYLNASCSCYRLSLIESDKSAASELVTMNNHQLKIQDLDKIFSIDFQDEIFSLHGQKSDCKPD